MKSFTLPYDDALLASKPNTTEYILDRSMYGMTKYK
jgi:hypothetical protein